MYSSQNRKGAVYATAPFGRAAQYSINTGSTPRLPAQINGAACIVREDIGRKVQMGLPEAQRAGGTGNFNVYGSFLGIIPVGRSDVQAQRGIAIDHSLICRDEHCGAGLHNGYRKEKGEGALKPPLLGLPCEPGQYYFLPFDACGVSQNALQIAPRRKTQSVKTCISLLKGEPPGWLSGGLSGYPALRLNVRGLLVF